MSANPIAPCCSAQRDAWLQNSCDEVIAEGGGQAALSKEIWSSLTHSLLVPLGLGPEGGHWRMVEDHSQSSTLLKEIISLEGLSAHSML